MKRFGIGFFALLFLGSGILHFVQPDFFEALMPPSWPRRVFNYLSGIAEIILAVGFLWRKTRKVSGYLLCGMLLVFWGLHGLHLLQPPNPELPYYVYVIRFVLQPVLLVLVWKLKDHPTETV